MPDRKISQSIYPEVCNLSQIPWIVWPVPSMGEGGDGWLCFDSSSICTYMYRFKTLLVYLFCNVMYLFFSAWRHLWSIDISDSVRHMYGWWRLPGCEGLFSYCIHWTLNLTFVKYTLEMAYSQFGRRCWVWVVLLFLL